MKSVASFVLVSVFLTLVSSSMSLGGPLLSHSAGTLTANQASSQSVEIAPILDALANFSNGGSSVSDGATSVNVQKLSFAQVDRRGVLEFNISTIPDTATITSASLDLHIITYTSSSGVYPILYLYGYAGNGTLEVADGQPTANHLGQSAPITTLSVITITLDPAYIQSLLASTNYLGVLAIGDENGYQAAFVTLEGAISGSRYAAKLKIQYTQSAPGVSAIAPPSGYSASSIDNVTITGSNFQAGATVKLARTGQSDIPASNVTTASSTRITCKFTLPSNTATGPWNVVVTNPDNQTGTLTSGFTVNAPLAFEATPTLDALTDFSNGGAFAIDGETSVNVQKVTFAQVDRRGVIEFNISSIPGTATITSASLDLHIIELTYSSGVYPILHLYGYAGNGTLEVADGQQTSNPIGQSTAITTFGVITIPLNAAYIQSWLASTNYLGVLAMGDENSKQAGFVTREGAVSGSRYAAKLKIQYAPAPLDVFGQITLNSYTGDVTSVPVTVEIQSTPVESHTVYLDAGRNYRFTTTLSGTYAVTAKASHWLKRKVSSLTLGTNPVNFVLTNGDCDGDNEVTGTDLSIVLGTMGTTPGSPAADLNGDGQITAADLTINLASMDAMGDK